MRKRRVVVTGMGMITPLGIGVEKSWRALCTGESGIARITKFDPGDFIRNLTISYPSKHEDL